MSSLRRTDPDIYNAINQERKRQNDTINLIASENYPSKAVFEAEASILTGKYSEGYPGVRYYGGCENVDDVEKLAIERAKELYKAEHANVQPHSGSQANTATYFALLEYGDTVMSMKMNIGGHLTHGETFNYSGRSYNFIRYGVDKETERIDFTELEKLAKQHRPKLIVTGASAYPRIIDFERFRYIADMVEARLMVDIAHTAGMIAAGLHPSPVPYADVVTSTTHKTLRGPRGGFILCRKELAQAIDSAVFPGIQGGMLAHIVAAKAVCFLEAMQPQFVEYQRAVLDNAYTLAEELKKLGLKLVSDGTDTHLVLGSLVDRQLSGKDVETALERANIVANRDPVPFDKLPGRITSGIRFGTPAVTTRGFGKEEMKQVATLIMQVIDNFGNSSIESKVKKEVGELCSKFPVPGIDN